MTEAAGRTWPTPDATAVGPPAPGGGILLDEAASTPLVRVSTSKLAILEKLRVRPMTVSELSRALGVHKSAVHRHVMELSGSGVLARRESERKWVYYALAPRGKRILMIGSTRFLAVVLFAGLLGLAATLAPAMLEDAAGPSTGAPSSPFGAQEEAADAQRAPALAADEQAGGPGDLFAVAFVVTLAAGLLVAVHLHYRVDRRRFAVEESLAPA